MGEDLAPLLSTLGELFNPGPLLWCPAFHGDRPGEARGWAAGAHPSWAAPPRGVIVGEQTGGAGAAEGEGPEEVDLTGVGAPPETPSRQLGAATWSAAFVDAFGECGGWDLLLAVRRALPGTLLPGLAGVPLRPCPLPA